VQTAVIGSDWQLRGCMVALCETLLITYSRKPKPVSGYKIVPL